MTDLFHYFAQGGLLPAFLLIAASFGEKVFVAAEEMEETDFASEEAEEDHAGAFDEWEEVCWAVGKREIAMARRCVQVTKLGSSIPG